LLYLPTLFYKVVSPFLVILFGPFFLGPRRNPFLLRERLRPLNPDCCPARRARPNGFRSPFFSLVLEVFFFPFFSVFFFFPTSLLGSPGPAFPRCASLLPGQIALPKKNRLLSLLPFSQPPNPLWGFPPSLEFSTREPPLSPRPHPEPLLPRMFRRPSRPSWPQRSRHTCLFPEHE